MGVARGRGGGAAEGGDQVEEELPLSRSRCEIDDSLLLGERPLQRLGRRERRRVRRRHLVRCVRRLRRRVSQHQRARKVRARGDLVRGGREGTPAKEEGAQEEGDDLNGAKKEYLGTVVVVVRGGGAGKDHEFGFGTSSNLIYFLLRGAS